MNARFIAFGLAIAIVCSAPAQGRQNPFQPPAATLHYSPDRTFDLIDVSVEIDVDYPKRTITGHVFNTLAPLRNGIQEALLHAGKGLDIQQVKVNGQGAAFRREERNLFVRIGSPKKGERLVVDITYTSSNAQGRGFGQGGGGWHWVQPGNSGNPDRVGFWTQGESEYNSEWVPTWDYPNDLATSQTTTTVPADWNVIGNGVLTSEKLSTDKARKTFTWKMSQPHATYLLAIYGGPFDIQKDKWEDRDLWYVVPKGSAYLIDGSFGDTRDMLTFFSQRLGVKYPWNKYAQCALFDFGGGMENVSATILGEGSLTEARDGFRRMAGLNAHELGHQWFGDLVTCYNWGDAWLNESFATFMEMIYMEHSRGLDAYLWEVEDNTSSYLQETRRYKRPLSTKLYRNGDDMFDSHTYPKGGVILHTLRRFLGDEAFFAGLKHYLDTWKHTPVESAQLRRAMTEATGINVEPFWAQWIDKPGHPVLDYTWEWKPDGAEMGPGKILLTVKQKQDTSDGTPIYDIRTKIGFATEGLAPAGFRFAPVHLTKAEETFEIPVPARALCVVLDPEHDFLREIPELHWRPEELRIIMIDSPNPSDRMEAMRRLMQSPSDETIAFIVDQLKKDNDPEQPVFRQVFQLANLEREGLRGFWLSQMDHPNIDRRIQAANALARLPANAATTAKFRAAINDREAIQVVVSAINALASWDAKSHADVFKKAQGIKDRRGRIKRAADLALEG